MGDSSDLIALICVAALFVYFLPTLIAFARNRRHRWVIAILNAVFAATGVGWIVLLAIACWPAGDAVPVELRRAPNAAAGDDSLRRLQKLGELRDAGVLSEAEFDRKKSKILSGA